MLERNPISNFSWYVLNLTPQFIYFPMGRLRYFLNGNDRWLKEKQYFGLPKFKEWWDKAAYAECYLSECEYEGSCGPGYQPLSEEEWKKQQK